MTQETLVRTPPKNEKPHEQPQAAFLRTEHDDNIWSTDEELRGWLRGCSEAQENFAYMVVEADSVVRVDGTREGHLHVIDTLGRPYRPEGDSYDGMWGTAGWNPQEQFTEIRKHIVEWLRELLRAPYCREHADGELIRDIRRENIRVFFTRRAQELIDAHAGWTVAELQTELARLPETALTEERLGELLEKR